MKKLFWQKGFTLPEMIVVIIIFTLIIVTVYSAYALNQRAYLEGEEMTEITQNGRVILERMSREIRQTKEIVTELPAERMNPPSEIKFQDGHLSVVSEENTAQGGGNSTIILAPTSSSENDYYKDMFIKIIGGTGAGQIRKVIDYEGAAKIAGIEGSWYTIPDSSSTYKIDNSFYYIHYYRDDNNNIWREVTTHCFSEDSVTCAEPEIYVPWDATPPMGQTLLEIILEEPRIIGEYLSNLEFWGSRIINIFLTLEKRNKSIELETKIFGRNL